MRFCAVCSADKGHIWIFNQLCVVIGCIQTRKVRYFHLLLSGPNTMLIFLVAVGFHTALFESEPETKLNHMWCLKSSFIGSSIQLYWSQYGCLVRTEWRIHTCQSTHKRGKSTWVWFNRTKQDRVNTPRMSVVYVNVLSPSTGEHYQQQAL